MSNQNKPPKLNARKERGVRKKVSENLILAKLHSDGFIKKTGDKTFEVNLTNQIESKWGNDGKPNQTTLDIRTILEKVIYGLKENGNSVDVKRILSIDD